MRACRNVTRRRRSRESGGDPLPAAGDAPRLRRERLTSDDEHESVAHRHFRHFLQLAELTHEQQLSGRPELTLETLASQQDNLRAALAFAQANDPLGLLHLATATEQLWLAGNIAEGWRWLEQALASAPDATPARVRALNTAAALTTLLQAWDQARQLVDESLALASTLGDEPGQAWARVRLGFIELAGDNPAAAIPHLEKSRATHHELGDRLGLCRSLLLLGVARTVTPDHGTEGRIELESALALAQELGDAWGIGFAQAYLGFAELDARQRDRAAIYFHLAVEQDPRRSVQLQAAASALRERDDALPPAWRTRRSAAIRAQAQAQHALDPAVAQEAWEDGQRMTTDEAIAYALGDQSPPRAANQPPNRAARAAVTGQ